jgi:hypothetical protein
MNGLSTYMVIAALNGCSDYGFSNVPNGEVEEPGDAGSTDTGIPDTGSTEYPSAPDGFLELHERCNIPSIEEVCAYETDQEGNIVRDESGNIVYETLCGLVVEGVHTSARKNIGETVSISEALMETGKGTIVMKWNDIIEESLSYERCRLLIDPFHNINQDQDYREAVELWLATHDGFDTPPYFPFSSYTCGEHLYLGEDNPYEDTYIIELGTSSPGQYANELYGEVYEDFNPYTEEDTIVALFHLTRDDEGESEVIDYVAYNDELAEASPEIYAPATEHFVYETTGPFVMDETEEILELCHLYRSGTTYPEARSGQAIFSFSLE